jgi:transposase InsO family protein
MIKYKQMVPVQWLCTWVGVSRSSWYYTCSDSRPGRKPSTHTIRADGTLVENREVVKQIRSILSQEFICYGYEKVTWELHDLGFIINKKKVYRLMSEAHLLHTTNRISTYGKRAFVQSRKVDASYPMQHLTMDIKYVYIHGEKRNVYLLTVMDVFTRKVLAHCLKPSIRQYDVVLLLEGIISRYWTKDIVIRNDNGSQFIAHSVRRYLKNRGISQEFTHIATPEENAYIEALHSTLEREVIQRYWFDSFFYAKWKIRDYYRVYNAKRKHRSLNRKTPDQIWNTHKKIMLISQFPLN